MGISRGSGEGDIKGGGRLLFGPFGFAGSFPTEISRGVTIYLFGAATT